MLDLSEQTLQTSCAQQHMSPPSVAECLIPAIVPWNLFGMEVG